MRRVRVLESFIGENWSLRAAVAPDGITPWLSRLVHPSEARRVAVLGEGTGGPSAAWDWVPCSLAGGLLAFGTLLRIGDPRAH